MVRRVNEFVENNFASWKALVRLTLGQLDLLFGRADLFIPKDLGGVDRLVFVCRGNINRSAFAHILAANAGIPVCSFGLSSSTGKPAFQRAIEVADEMGVDMRSHRTTDISDFTPTDRDLYLVMETRHAWTLVDKGFPKHKIALLGYWSRPQRLHLHDPYENSAEYFRSCFTLIRSAVENLTREFLAAKEGSGDLKER